jgi:hypothetical protein
MIAHPADKWSITIVACLWLILYGDRMNSPLRRKAQKLAHDEKLPTDNWLMRRAETMKSHAPSVNAVIGALRDMGALILDKRISTDLLIEEKTDLRNIQPAKEIGHVSCSVIPIVGRSRPATPYGSGFSWTPDVALQVNFSFQDKYDRGTGSHEDRRKPTPTGQVYLQLHTRTWGHLSSEEATEINALENTWTEYGDQGHSRRGTSVTARREPGQIITELEAETILAPLAEHVISYFDLVGRPDLAAYQGPGNFTSL